jgi:hypothetical protein
VGYRQRAFTSFKTGGSLCATGLIVLKIKHLSGRAALRALARPACCGSRPDPYSAAFTFWLYIAFQIEKREMAGQFLNGN